MNVYPKSLVFLSGRKNLQWYLKLGKGFHSNDTRAVVQQNGQMIDTYGSWWWPRIDMEARTQCVVQTALWQLWMDQNLFYVGDAEIVEPSGKTGRLGLDLSASITSWHEIVLPIWTWTLARPRVLHNSAEPVHSTRSGDHFSGRIELPNAKGISASLRYRYIGDRPANETNEVIATGYTVFDLQCTYRKGAVTLGTQINNLFNTRWKKLNLTPWAGF